MDHTTFIPRFYNSKTIYSPIYLFILTEYIILLSLTKCNKLLSNLHYKSSKLNLLNIY